MSNEKADQVFQLLASIRTMPPEKQAVYRKHAGENLGRIRDLFFPNKLSALAAKLQEGNFRSNLNPKDLERQIRRWISTGLPLGNIEEMSQALDLCPSEFIQIETPYAENGHLTTDPPVPLTPAVDARAAHHDNIKNNCSYCDLSNKKIGFGKLKQTYFAGGLVFFLLVGVVLISLGSGRLKYPRIEIIWPEIIDTHSEYVSGQLSHLSAGELKEAVVQLFVKPADGDTKYWLDIPPFPGIVTEKGIWYQKCRFGDEDFRTMKRAPPLRFDLYAVLLKKSAKLPVKDGSNYIEAPSEVRFLEILKPHVQSVSNRFSITRVKPAKPDTPVVIGVTPPVRVTWAEAVPMYLEIYHGGQIVKNGYFRSGERHDLPPSPILYEIKMSRKKGYHQNNIWILVEDDNT